MSEQRFGKYELLGFMAAGGMGEIYLARRLSGDRQLLALKRIQPHLATDPSFIKMFLNEAKFAARLVHPNIVQIHDLGLEGSDYFMALEYVRGHNLRSVLRTLRSRKRPVAPGIAAQIASQVLGALHYAHSLTGASGAALGVIHRDVSPDNLLVSAEGHVKLVDFGIAKALDHSTGEVSGVKGKFAYMAPEQLQGRSVDRRADIYSVGCILYEMLAGEQRFAAEGPAALIRDVLEGPTPSLASKRPELPEALIRIVDRAVHRARDERFATAHEMALALDHAMASQGQAVGPSAVARWLVEAMGNPVAEHLLRAEGAMPRPSARATPVETKKVLATGEPPPDIARLARTRVAEATPAPRNREAAPTVRVEAPVALAPQQAVVVAPARATQIRSVPWPWIGAGATALVTGALGYWLLTTTATNRSPDVSEPPLQASQEALAEGTKEERDSSPSPPRSTEGTKAAGDALSPPIEAPHRPPEVDRTLSDTDRGGPQGSPETSLRPVVSKPIKRRPGRVTVLSQPWAEVFWNQRSLGITPLTHPVELPAGRHLLVLRNTELGLERQVPVEVPPGETVEVKATLEPR